MLINKNIFPGQGFADPHAIVENGRVYIFSGHDKTPRTENTWIMDKWQIISSADLINWRKDGEILPTQTYIGESDTCWAGYIQKKDNKFYWYFSNKFYDTGVVVSDQIEGPYVDILQKPLIPAGFSDTKSYDPCVFEENGVHTIFFGAGHYYCATLGDDMMSLASDAARIHVYDEDGNECQTSDKSTVFKVNDTYYLAYGSKYAISDKLKGPYKFMGKFIGGGHNDVFKFNDKLYLCNEFHDTSIFYRGIRVMELNFNSDGTVVIDKDDEEDVHFNKTWDFTNYNMHWFLTNGENSIHENSAIVYNLSTDLALRSPLWPGVAIQANKDYTLTMEIEQSDNHVFFMATIMTASGIGAYWNTLEKDCEIYNVELINICDNVYQAKIPKIEKTPVILRYLSICAKNDKIKGFVKIKNISFK
ncbi:MAG: family 43 glycosylhydrolase [Clostridia bacterium]